jgi:hypothetical protein
VITTDEPPMNEVAGDSAYYLPRLKSGADLDAWSAGAAHLLRRVLGENALERERRTLAGQRWARRFDCDRAIDAYLAIYERVLDQRALPVEIEPSLGQGTRL